MLSYDMQQQLIAMGMMIGQDNPSIDPMSIDFEQIDELIQKTYGIVIPRGTDLQSACLMIANQRLAILNQKLEKSLEDINEWS